MKGVRDAACTDVLEKVCRELTAAEGDLSNALA
jgi:hypothetical protein